ncbi:CbrC family protein [Streptomyces sp. S.PB5]|uniref:CbrC family protein n=1 Tax=Streptomyces sp. S.PB5 TaxID=3020844 RepID=UPI0025B1CFCE|nr:CbrC family protein [Streptomyces sp. S.PB5]MDN3023017.1 CbrC family protein [Streptomyces sp. S.PB5]
MTTLPSFRYHPDPVATGSVVPSDAPCDCCGRSRGFAYDGPVFGVDDPAGALCPWCLADGSAAARYEAQFTEAEGRIPLEVRVEVERRTPGFRGRQQEQWLTHCGDAAAFLGRAGAAGVKEYPEALGDLLADHGEDFCAALDADGQPTAYLFRCLHCDRHLAYADCT